MKINEVAGTYEPKPIRPELDKSKSINKNLNIIKPILAANCKEILSIYKNAKQFLYRGMHTHETKFARKIRRNRKPSQMPSGRHDLTNQAIQALGGVATRGNSIFCTTDENIAVQWGETFVIFPKDGWHVTYFLEHDSDYLFHDLLSVKPTLEAYIKFLKELEISFSKRDMPKAMKFTNEFLISGHSFIALSLDAYGHHLTKWIF